MAYKTKNFAAFVPYIERIPPGQFFDIDFAGKELSFQADGDAVGRLRVALGPRIWKKEYQDGLWWEYTADLGNGITAKIYADRTGPKSCKRIEETVTEIVHVPAREAHDEKVTKTVVRWECPDGEEVTT